MLKQSLWLTAGVALSVASMGVSADQAPPGCGEVGFAQVNWTGVTLKTETAAMILEALGYDTEVTTVSVQIAFEAVAQGERDAFLGLWLPTQASMVEPYLEEGRLEKLTANLEGAKYTLAVPEYVHDAGVTSFEDLDEHREAFEGQILGIEPGNDGNVLIQDMIDDDAYGLGDWQLVESSEAGMLAEVQRAADSGEWVVFLGWAPHPMNRNIDMAYLTGGEAYFGKNQGEATVHTLVGEDYKERCGNVARLLEQFTFEVSEQNQGEAYVMDEGMSSREAGKALMRANPELLDRWLEGVTARDGEASAREAVSGALGL